MQNGTTDDGTAPEVLTSPGKLPPFWDQNAVFVANLLGLFFGNEAETRQMVEEVGEVDSYGGRLIPIIDLLFRGKGRNLLVLEHEPDAALCRYFEATIGLSLPETLVLPHREYLAIGRDLASHGRGNHPAMDRITDHPSAWIDGYVTDLILAQVAEKAGKATLSSASGSHRGNNKRLLHQHLEAIGLPVPHTELATSPDEVPACLDRIRRAGFSSGVVKSAIGASGIGLIRVDDLSLEARSLAGEVPDHFFFEGPCLVQGWLKPGEFGVRTIRSPSVQLFLNENGVTLFDITEQILSHASVHEGNESPPPYLHDQGDLKAELLRQAGLAGQWLHRQGYRGTASADFLVATKESGANDVYVCELNARVTGATYPSILARHFLPDGAWLMRNLRFTEPMTGKSILERLLESGDLFVPGGSGTGVLPMNFNFDEKGMVQKGQFLCLAHSTAGNHLLLKMAEIDLPCLPDRD